jgi:hypothetical protein
VDAGIYEAMLAQILVTPDRAFTCFRFHSFYRDAFGVLVLRKSPDKVAQMNGWCFHTDGIHLNTRGGMIVADLFRSASGDRFAPLSMTGENPVTTIAQRAQTPRIRMKSGRFFRCDDGHPMISSANGAPAKYDPE